MCRVIPRFRKDRTRPIVAESTYRFDDEIRISLPEGYVYPAGQSTDSSTTDFGNYTLDIKQDGQKLIVKTCITVNKGRFDISRKDDFAGFREKASKMLNKQIIIEKK